MQLSILSTSDIHGHIRADDFRRPLLNDSLGLSRAATVIADYQQQAKLAGDISLTIENGDFIQGSPLANYIEKVATTRQVFIRNWRMLFHMMCAFLVTMSLILDALISKKCLLRPQIY